MSPVRLVGRLVAGRARLSLRTRLALIYGSMFLLAGLALAAVTYGLTASTVNARFKVTVFEGKQDGAGGVTGLVAAPSKIGIQNRVDQEVAGQRQALLDELLRGSVLTLVALCLLATVIGYLVAGRTLRPLQTVTATARRLSDSNLHERIGLTGPRDEIRDLADTFDAMLDRLHRAFDSQRRFIANASHELRTPLAISRASIEVALAKPAVPPETRALAAKLLDATERHERLIEGLLTLARSEREPRHRTRVDLRDVAAAAVGQLTDAAADAGVTVDADLGEAVATGDAVLLERCVVNLLENAVKYNVTGGAVRIRTGTVQGWACAQVENTGPGLTTAQATAIFDPFTRLDRPRVGSAKGAGLGLSIVQAVTAAHGGHLQATPRDAGGLRITLHLPPPSVREPEDHVVAAPA